MLGKSQRRVVTNAWQIDEQNRQGAQLTDVIRLAGHDATRHRGRQIRAHRFFKFNRHVARLGHARRRRAFQHPQPVMPICQRIPLSKRREQRPSLGRYHDVVAFGPFTRSRNLMHGRSGNREFPAIQFTADMHHGDSPDTEGELKRQCMAVSVVAGHRRQDLQRAIGSSQCQRCQVLARVLAFSGYFPPNDGEGITGEFDDIATVRANDFDDAAEEIIERAGEHFHPRSPLACITLSQWCEA